MQAEATQKRRESGKGAKQTRAGKLRLPSLDDLDKRTAAYREATELRNRIASERGGLDILDVRTLASIESWAVATTIIKGMEVSWLQGLPVDFTEYSTMLNARRREGEMIGAPQPRDVTPSLRQYLAGQAA
ncbi:hypothetical protein EN780_24075 [Mesorhizobium sp. M4B.F.Ca.ET.089.01.1.1]|uniref:hypothetical protein n=1 Tax=Mesorhizobium sp. M4B.F.Ca.ET.089.01.1.1 TaxID=2496662 RepID=UPI000FE2AD72|nr:hypothetical protein [Mesorhizobium sp. M4B.F.Ca.ET.089.01.1.1]RWX63314.1 hypothetical protein EN780_24075 [Mesorhizobium sp. M4B.F.Ca.ET.089.01.1.1]